MKKKKLILKNVSFILCCVYIFFSFSLISCTNSIKSFDEEKSDYLSENENQKYGYLNLTFANNSKSEGEGYRAILSLDEIENYVSKYELIYFNNEIFHKIPLTLGESKVVIPAGKWNILCLAGQKDFLVGSGYVNDVVIEEEKITQIQMNMYLIDVSLSSDKSVVNYNESYKVTAEVDTKNPYLIPGYIYANRSRIEFKTESSYGCGESEYTAPSDSSVIEFSYSTSLIKFKTENFDLKLSECSDFKGIINSTLLKKNGVTFLEISVKKDTVLPNLGLSINWIE